MTLLFKGDSHTIDRLYIDGKYFCDTIEDPVRELNTGKYIADYDPNHNQYELSGHDYVVWNGCVFRPEIDVNADIPELGVNFAPHDPRNYNLKKHMVRLAIYELTKLIAPNNVSTVRIRDYEESRKWLNDASKLRIDRRLAEDRKEIMD